MAWWRSGQFTPHRGLLRNGATLVYSHGPGHGGGSQSGFLPSTNLWFHAPFTLRGNKRRLFASGPCCRRNAGGACRRPAPVSSGLIHSACPMAPRTLRNTQCRATPDRWCSQRRARGHHSCLAPSDRSNRTRETIRQSQARNRDRPSS